jgi:2-C-methyl-D-erythritol 4-phosphate cytidylyltransferase
VSTPPTLRIGVVVVAAGSGQRLGYGIPKAEVVLAGRTLLEHALDSVLASGVASRVCVAVPPGDIRLRGICSRIGGKTVVAVVEGGGSRAESVGRALAGLGTGLDAVLVHDAARALTPPEVFTRVAAALASGAQAVIPAVPVADTIKTAGPSSPQERSIAGEKVSGTPERAILRAVQTPQGFDARVLAEAHEWLESAGEDAAGITDDAMLVERRGVTVYLVPGSQDALKITTELDLMTAEALAERRHVSAAAPGQEGQQ